MSVAKLNTLVSHNSVVIGSLQHIVPILIALGITVFLVGYTSKYFSEIQKQKIIHFFAWFVSCSVISFHAYRMGFENYNFQTDLPLYLCSLMALLIPLFTYYRKYWMFEILVFWIIGGTFCRLPLFRTP